jgi:hypothetical protein
MFPHLFKLSLIHSGPYKIQECPSRNYKKIVNIAFARLLGPQLRISDESEETTPEMRGIKNKVLHSPMSKVFEN